MVFFGAGLLEDFEELAECGQSGVDLSDAVIGLLKGIKISGGDAGALAKSALMGPDFGDDAGEAALLGEHADARAGRQVDEERAERRAIDGKRVESDGIVGFRHGNVLLPDVGGMCCRGKTRREGRVRLGRLCTADFFARDRILLCRGLVEASAGVG